MTPRTSKTNDKRDLLERAIRIAAAAHRGQRDKAGAVYILHPLRLMLKLDDPVERIVAVLHDVVEDSAWSLDGLRASGFGNDVIDALGHLTKSEGEDYETFIARAAKNPIARAVKLADLEDNLDLTRLGTLNDKDCARMQKYVRARERLRGTPADFRER